jgi:hypothetical protein
VRNSESVSRTNSLSMPACLCVPFIGSASSNDCLADAFGGASPSVPFRGHLGGKLLNRRLRLYKMVRVEMTRPLHFPISH